MNAIELNSKVWAALQERRVRLPHALLLSGPKGLGKAEIARQFAAGLLCEDHQSSGLACGKCLPCNWFGQGNHPDFRLLQPDAFAAEAEAEEGKKKASQQITIDQVRELDEFLNVGTHRGGLRIVLINPAEAMNRSTANSLLKSLEEPSPDTLFLMVSNEPMRLLPTIRSRCQLVPFALPGRELARKILAADGVAEAERWLALAGGSPGLAIDLAKSGKAGWLDMMTRRLAAGRQCDPLNWAQELDKAIKDSKGKLGLKSLIETLQKWVVDLNLARNGQPIRYFLPQATTISTLAAMIPTISLIHFYRALIVRRQEAEQPLNGRLFLEGVFLDYRGLFANDRP